MRPTPTSLLKRQRTRIMPKQVGPLTGKSKRKICLSQFTKHPLFPTPFHKLWASRCLPRAIGVRDHRIKVSSSLRKSQDLWLKTRKRIWTEVRHKDSLSCSISSQRCQTSLRITSSSIKRHLVEAVLILRATLNSLRRTQCPINLHKMKNSANPSKTWDNPAWFPVVWRYSHATFRYQRTKMKTV